MQVTARCAPCRALPAATRAAGQRPGAPAAVRSAAVRSAAARSVVARPTPLCGPVRSLQVGQMRVPVRVLLGQPLPVLVPVVRQRRGGAGENWERGDRTERKGARAGGPTPSATPRCCPLMQHPQRSHRCRARTIARADCEEEHRATLEATRCWRLFAGPLPKAMGAAASRSRRAAQTPSQLWRVGAQPQGTSPATIGLPACKRPRSRAPRAEGDSWGTPGRGACTHSGPAAHLIPSGVVHFYRGCLRVGDPARRCQRLVREKSSSAAQRPHKVDMHAG